LTGGGAVEPGFPSSRRLGIGREEDVGRVGEKEGARGAVRVRDKSSMFSPSSCSVSSTSPVSRLVLSKSLCRLLFLALFSLFVSACVFVFASSLSDIWHEREMRCRIERC